MQDQRTVTVVHLNLPGVSDCSQRDPSFNNLVHYQKENLACALTTRPAGLCDLYMKSGFD